MSNFPPCFSLDFNNVPLENVSSTDPCPKPQDPNVMREEASYIGNPSQKKSSGSYDKFTEKEEEVIAQMIKDEAISLGVLSRNQLTGWKEVVLGMGLDFWKSVVPKIARKLRPKCDCSKSAQRGNMIQKVKRTLQSPKNNKSKIKV